jgi:hypothetical protein
VSADAAPESAEARERYTRALLESAREERALADTKASLLLASVGVAVSVGVSAALGGSWTPSNLAAVPGGLWWMATAAVIAGVLLLAGAVYPRLRQEETAESTGTVVTFLEINRVGDLPGLRAALTRSADEEFDTLSRQLRVMSRLVERKYVLIQWALWAFLAAGVLELLAWMAGRL